MPFFVVFPFLVVPTALFLGFFLVRLRIHDGGTHRWFRPLDQCLAPMVPQFVATHSLMGGEMGRSNKARAKPKGKARRVIVPSSSSSSSDEFS